MKEERGGCLKGATRGEEQEERGGRGMQTASAGEGTERGCCIRRCVLHCCCLPAAAAAAPDNDGGGDCCSGGDDGSSGGFSPKRRISWVTMTDPCMGYNDDDGFAWSLPRWLRGGGIATTPSVVVTPLGSRLAQRAAEFNAAQSADDDHQHH